MQSSLLSFFSLILERKNALCHSAYTSLMIVFVDYNYSITLLLQGQRGFLFILMVNQGTSHVIVRAGKV